MPNVKDLKNKKNEKAAPEVETAEQLEMEATTSSENRSKRRPGREMPEASDADVKVVDVEEGVRPERTASHSSSDDAHAKSADPAQFSTGTGSNGKTSSFEEPHGPKFELNFFGSELIRAKFPRPFEVVEAVAQEWTQGGDFSHLPIKHPLGQFAAQKGLQKAKEVEKKVLESPVTEKVAMQALTMGLKAQGLVEKLRQQLAAANKKD